MNLGWCLYKSSKMILYLCKNTRIMIKGIIFDLGGVLVDINLQRCIESFIKYAGMETITDILDSCHQKGIIGDMEEGKIDEDGFLSMARTMCRPGTSDRTIRECMISILDEIQPERLELVRSLKGKYDLYLLSNNNPVVMNYLEPKFAEMGFPMDELFIKCFYSYKMKVLKPSEEFFRRAIKEIGLPPRELLFIDDSILNIEAARRCGLNAEQHIKGSTLEETVMRGLKNTSSPA